jgi:peptidoglycan/LPS O-acetylase OafA/YrhL
LHRNTKNQWIFEAEKRQINFFTMSVPNTQNGGYADTPKHYEILDGLRGVAAIMVIVFHILETFTAGNHKVQIINHGYLAVDFFYVLSGFVIAYAYDKRWGNMSLGAFFKRRLIRLHPMIVFGMVVGAVCFYFGASATLFPKIAETSVPSMLLLMFIGCTLIPVPPSMDIRGWNETYPLNGPAWSLFYEYLANIAYALVLRRVSTAILTILTLLAAIVLVHFATTNASGDLIGGWSLDPAQLRTGFTRVTFPFLAGMLLSRVFRPIKVNYAFLWCSALVILAMSLPRFGGDAIWINGLYDSLTVIFLFPFIVLLGASGTIQNEKSLAACRFLGNISYPIYIVHYPLIYIYTAWAVNNNITMRDGLGMGLLVLVGSIALAYAAFKWYDVPVRRWLAGRFVR